MKRIILFLLVSVPSATLAKPLFQPFSDQTVKKILGSDKDHNGIRDEIDDYIKSRAKGSERKLAALAQVARSYQKSFGLINDEEKAIAAEKDFIRATDCLEAVYGSQDYTELSSLEAELYNTRERTLAAVRLSYFFSRISLKPTTKEERIKSCDFDFYKLKE